MPGDHDLLLQVTTAGVCGTDLAEVTHGPSLTPVFDRHPLTGHVGPITLGHEFAGVVVATGSATTTPVGSHVASGSGVSCGACPACRAGKTNLCSAYWTVGFHADGGLADYCVVPESVCVAFDETVLTDDAAALAQPMSIAVHAARAGNLAPAARVMVIGAGGIGAFLVAVVKHMQPDAQVVVMEPDPERRAVARQMGCDDALAPGDMVEGTFNTIFEVSGTQSGLLAAATAVVRGGTIVLVGIQHPGDLDRDLLRTATLDEISLVGASAHVLHSDFPTALEILAARQDWSAVAPVVGSLEDCAEQLAQPGAGRPIKSLFSPQAASRREANYSMIGEQR